VAEVFFRKGSLMKFANESRRKFFDSVCLVVMLSGSLLLSSVAAQSTKKTTSQKPPTGKVGTALPGQEASCEGVLEIVPRKQMTFVRQRRPGKRETSPATKSESDPGAPAK
jgi:hypothetical protein